MRLDVNPFTIISPPRLAGKNDPFNVDVANQWKLWKKEVKQVRDIFGKMVRKKKAWGAESQEFQSYLGTLKMNSAYVQKNVRDDMALTAAVDGEVIIEAARRFLLNETLPEFSDVDEHGYLPWEKDLE